MECHFEALIQLSQSMAGYAPEAAEQGRRLKRELKAMRASMADYEELQRELRESRDTKDRAIRRADRSDEEEYARRLEAEALRRELEVAKNHEDHHMAVVARLNAAQTENAALREKLAVADAFPCEVQKTEDRVRQDRDSRGWWRRLLGLG